jgi:hypothetical protein
MGSGVATCNGAELYEETEPRRRPSAQQTERKWLWGRPRSQSQRVRRNIWRAARATGAEAGATQSFGSPGVPAGGGPQGRQRVDAQRRARRRLGPRYASAPSAVYPRPGPQLELPYALPGAEE